MVSNSNNNFNASATIFIAISSVMIWALLGNVPMASADDDPQSDRACDEMVDLEVRKDARIEDESTNHSR
jgi:hypothetical protein